MHHPKTTAKNTDELVSHVVYTGDESISGQVPLHCVKVFSITADGWKRRMDIDEDPEKINKVGLKPQHMITISQGGALNHAEKTKRPEMP